MPALVFVALFFMRPQLYMESFSNGLSVWSASVLPSLFPFLFLSNILANTDSLRGFSQKAGIVSQKLFRAPRQSSLVFVLSMLCGYPIGAKSVAELYEKGMASTDDCYKMTTFCSTASPIYAIGTVGINFLGSLPAGLVLFASLLLGQFFCALLYRNKFAGDTRDADYPPFLKKSGDVIGDSLFSALKSILSVGAYIALFYMLCEMAANAAAAVLPAKAAGWTTLFAVGFLEMTNGCYAYASCFPLQTATVLCSIAMSFGGICVYLQCFAYYKKCSMSGGRVLCIKLIQGILSGLICLPLSLLLL